MVNRDPRIHLQEENQIDLGGEDYKDQSRIHYFVLIIRNVHVEDRGGFAISLHFVHNCLNVALQIHVSDQYCSDEVANWIPEGGRPA